MEISAGRPQERRRLQRVACAVGLFVIGIMGRSVPIASSQTGTGDPNISKRPTILFMCPHGAAKSVLASAYFQRLAKERGLNVHVESAGTEPDATVSSAVAAHLKGKATRFRLRSPGRSAPRSSPPPTSLSRLGVISPHCHSLAGDWSVGMKYPSER